jgi:transcriptional regulator with XRE-family HTH domain
MRLILQTARKQAGKKQTDIAKYLGIAPRYYQKIEAGQNNGHVRLWDALEALFEFKIPQRELRRDFPKGNYTNENGGVARKIA